MVNDAVADFLARLQNTVVLKKNHLELPHTKMVYNLAQVLKEEGFFTTVKKFKEGKQEKVHLSLAPESLQSYRLFRRLSKPGRRLYRSVQQLRRFTRGGALTVVSTSRGLMTVSKARKLSLGGELVCELN